MRHRIPKTLKLSPLQICIGASIVVHLALVGAVVELAEMGTLPPGPPQSEPAMTITLMAAPEKPIEPPKPVVMSSVPPEVEPLKIVETILPVAKIVERVVTETAKPVPIVPVVTSLVAEKSSDKGNSPKPSPDSTTVTEQPVITAQPDYLKNPEPPYPLTARRRHQEGLVLLLVKVDSQGRTMSVAIKNSSGFPLLDAAAQESVRGWEFQPARTGLLAVESEMEVPVRFKLTP